MCLGATNFKKQYADILKKFKKIYIHSEEDIGAETFINSISKVLPCENLFKINSKALGGKDPSELHIKGLLDIEKLLDTAEKIEYVADENKSNTQGEIADHVRIGEQIMKEIPIKYYKERFRIYDKGVYVENVNIIKQKINLINRNIKNNARTEILKYLEIETYIDEIPINKRYVNFKNGLYDLVENKLIEHTPDVYSTCQINAEYIDDIEVNSDVEEYLKQIFCDNADRIKAFKQMLGYCFTYKTDCQKAFFFLRRNSKQSVNQQ